MNFTKDELKWIAQTSPKFDDMLTELNQRTRAYKTQGGWTLERAQKQALIDFRNQIKPGQFIALKDVDAEGNYFKAAK